jgi:hypothetical protein
VCRRAAKQPVPHKNEQIRNKEEECREAHQLIKEKEEEEKKMERIHYKDTVPKI